MGSMPRICAARAAALIFCCAAAAAAQTAPWDPLDQAVRPALATPPSARRSLDHSCSPWGLSVSGLDDALASINCRTILTGRVGTEGAILEVRWTAALVTLPDGSRAPFTAQLVDGRPA